MRIKLSEEITLNDIRALFGYCAQEYNPVITHVTTDTHEINKDDLFVGISGKKFDGSDFTDIANNMGALTLTTDDNATVKASSANDILHRLITFFKSRLTNLKYTVAITGSVGKTTTKELLYALCRKKYKTHASYKNYNNLVGLFHTVLSAPTDTEVLIAEAGMNSRGEIKELSELLTPGIAIISALGNAHIGMLGSREQIACAKLEICDALKDTGKTVIPYGEPLLNSAKNKFTFSMTDNQADAFFIPLKFDSDGTLFDFYSHGKAICGIKFSIPGEHIFSCLMAAFSAALLLGIPLRELSSQINKLTPDILRPTMLELGKYTVYNDSYSSSPDALRETMRMLTLYDKPLSAVIGDMLELGASSASYHRDAGRDAARLGYKKLYLVGSDVRHTAEGAIACGIKKENIHINKDINNLESTINAIEKSYDGEIILIKASHSTGLDRLIKMMIERWT